MPPFRELNCDTNTEHLLTAVTLQSGRCTVSDGASQYHRDFLDFLRKLHAPSLVLQADF